MIHKVDEGYVISSYNTWVPGVYDSERAAKYAFRFDNEDLTKLQNHKNKTTKVITFEDLQELRKELKTIKKYTQHGEEKSKPFKFELKKEKQMYVWTKNGNKPLL